MASQMVLLNETVDEIVIKEDLKLSIASFSNETSESKT